MPEHADPKLHPHPIRTPAREGSSSSSSSSAASRPPFVASSLRRSVASYVPLEVTSNFTFLTGASHPDEYVERAYELGLGAIAITDTNTLAGTVRAHVATKQLQSAEHASLTTLPAASRPSSVAPSLRRSVASLSATRLTFINPSTPQVLAYPTDRASYARLCQLLTIGRRRAPKGECHLMPQDLLEYSEGLQLILIPPPILDETALAWMDGLAHARPRNEDAVSIGLHRCFLADDQQQIQQRVQLSDHLRVPLVALNDVHYHVPQRRALQDVVTCIRLGCTLHNAGTRLLPNGERYLKSPAAMQRIFADFPEALQRTLVIAERAQQFNLDQLRYEYPDEICPVGQSPIQHLTNLVNEGARERYPDGVPGKVQSHIAHELKLIDELNYAPYFLTVHDLVVFARERNILCQGRGAAANSAVCYALGVTSVDPDRIDVLFERFVSRERDEPPDIDIDFEHERREEVIQYIYDKYGRDRAALTATVITYRSRSAIREVGKALGLSLDLTDRLAKSVDWWHKTTFDQERWKELGLDPENPTLKQLSELASELLGFPRHLSQHVGGFVITRDKLSHIVPVQNAAMPDRTVIEWDKDDIDALNILKVDVLGLGMLSCVRKTLESVWGKRRSDEATERRSEEGRSRDAIATEFLHLSPLGERPGEGPNRCGSNGSSPAASRPHSVASSLRRSVASLSSFPHSDPNVYDAICRADTVGVFQIESRAQMSMLPRLRPRTYYDLVIEVAIVRPGPIHGDMVHPYLRRRNGEEPVSYPSETVRTVLEKTLGVPLFQEQAMALAMHCASFTPGEADALRRSIASWKSHKNAIARYGEKLIDGMIRNGYEREFAERVFKQIQGFSEYGFPESHAASFAHIVYASAWLHYYYPAEFAAGILNSQPMGFYAPAQLVQDAQQHGVEVRPVDVNHSQWDCTLEPRGASSSGGDAESDPWTQPDPAKRAVQHTHALRLGMRLVKGLKQGDADAIAHAVAANPEPFQSIVALWRASGASTHALRKLAAADAFTSMGLDRQAAVWTVRSLNDQPMPLFEEVLHTDSPAAIERQNTDLESLPELTGAQEVLHDYATTRLSLKKHPIAFLRPTLEQHSFTTSVDLRTDIDQWTNGQRIRVAGLVLVRQRPATASGIVFMTLEDETGIINLIVRPTIYQRYRTHARHTIAIGARGTVERQGDVIHIMVTAIESLDHLVHQLASNTNLPKLSRNFR